MQASISHHTIGDGVTGMKSSVQELIHVHPVRSLFLYQIHDFLLHLSVFASHSGDLRQKFDCTSDFVP